MRNRWELYEKLAEGTIDSRYDRQIAISDTVDNFLSGIEGDPAYQSDALVNGQMTPIVASQTTSHECDLKAVPGTDINVGDIVECLGMKWIVVELFTDKVGIVCGTMWACNDSIRFQNGNSIIYTKHCVIDDGTYSKNTSDDIAVAVDNTYKIYISIDDETRRLYVDKRLALGVIYDEDGEQILEVYKITGIDTKSKNCGPGSHLMVLTLQRDVYSEETDSIPDVLCNIVAVLEQDAPEGNSVMKIVGPVSVRIGTTRKFSVEPDVAQLEWSISGLDSIKCTFDDSGCAVSVPFAYGIVGETFCLHAVDLSGEYDEAVLEVEVISIG